MAPRRIGKIVEFGLTNDRKPIVVTLTMPNEDYVYLAKLAEQAERYEGQYICFYTLVKC